MQQPEGFKPKGQKYMVYKLQISIYGLKQASQSWNIRFDQAVKTYGFDQNVDEPIREKVQDKAIVFLILYVNDILLIDNNGEYYPLSRSVWQHSLK